MAKRLETKPAVLFFSILAFKITKTCLPPSHLTYRSPAAFTFVYSALSSDLKPRHLLKHLRSDRTSPGTSLSLRSRARTPHRLVLTHCSPQKPVCVCRCFPHRNPVQVTSTITAAELQLISICSPTGEKDLPERTWVSCFHFQL